MQLDHPPLTGQPNPEPVGVGQPKVIRFFDHPIEDDPHQAGLKMIIEHPLTWHCPGHYNCFARGGHKCKCKRIHYRHFLSGKPRVLCVKCWDKRARKERANGQKPDEWPDNCSLSEHGAVWPAWPA
ncbi:hypothetical protein B484DRAFT_406178 [Ochromonadaceae sp. CCMP2298]|nr:hypothetical protein B484DRAFT_406178 [Ochromonadaceae sp. CCMP2298]